MVSLVPITQRLVPFTFHTCCLARNTSTFTVLLHVDRCSFSKKALMCERWAAGRHIILFMEICGDLIDAFARLLSCTQ